MAAAKNDITGDSIKTGANSKKFNDNWDRIFLKQPKEKKHKDITNYYKKVVVKDNIM